MKLLDEHEVESKQSTRSRSFSRLNITNENTNMVQSQNPTGAGPGGGASAGPSQSAARSVRTEPSNTGSQTQTTQEADIAETQTEPILRLRGEHAPRGRGGPRVQWAESVVDNEGMGKKSSKGENAPSFLFYATVNLYANMRSPLAQSAASTTLPKP